MLSERDWPPAPATPGEQETMAEPTFHGDQRERESRLVPEGFDNALPTPELYLGALFTF